MTRQYRSFLFASLVPAFCLVSAFDVVAAAQEQGSHAVKQELWSNPATWPDQKVPRAGDEVTIESGKDVVLDVSSPPLHGLTVKGKLSFTDKADVELTTEWVMLFGELEIGTEAQPHTHKATITLTDTVPNEEMAGMGDRGIMVLGGTLNLHGDRTNSWSKLSRTAEAGSSIDTGAGCQRLAGRGSDCARLNGFRSPPGRAANHLRHHRQYDHAR